MILILKDGTGCRLLLKESRGGDGTQNVYENNVFQETIFRQKVLQKEVQ